MSDSLLYSWTNGQVLCKSEYFTLINYATECTITVPIQITNITIVIHVLKHKKCIEISQIIQH